MTDPMVFLGETRSVTILNHIRERGWGRIFCGAHTDGAPKLAWPEEPWAFDNGAFVCFRRGVPFNSDRFMTRVENATKAKIKPPVLAVTPDIVAGGVTSLEFSLGWREELPDDWPWYLAVQDGMTLDDVSPCLDRFSGIFLGGTIRFKAQAAGWRALATQFGLKFHYGRASTLSRLDTARLIEADSLDTAFPLWTYPRLHTFMRSFLREPFAGQFAIGPGAVTPRQN